MQAVTYPATLSLYAPDDIHVSFRDIPEVVTAGDDESEALENAEDALLVALEGYLRRGRAIPDASPLAIGEVLVPVEHSLAARILLSKAMAAQQVSQGALAQRLGRDEKVVQRLLTGRRGSLKATLTALRLLGVRTALAA